MIQLAPLFGLLLVAAISPGPNNFFVLDAALRGGFRAAIPVIFGIVAGSILLLLVLEIGISTLHDQNENLSMVLATGAAAYLIWLGWSLLSNTRSGHETSKHPSQSPIGAAVFQFLNPKAWITMSLVTQANQSMPIALVLIVTVTIFASCLSFWALAGSHLSVILSSPAKMIAINRLMAGLLIALAGVIMFQHGLKLGL